jgi:hypothetical protein
MLTDYLTIIPKTHTQTTSKESTNGLRRSSGGCRSSREMGMGGALGNSFFAPAPYTQYLYTVYFLQKVCSSYARCQCRYIQNEQIALYSMTKHNAGKKPGPMTSTYGFIN